ncbi:hypothetical protein [Niallia sp. NCCP-28]|uniref:hypothetical protein n=1 Tax=Niallia sp. NCCP-28 TaxID=2934712 RepID=UPI002084440B|nr:hypothetical protein [Niallia sp. NCCP-28]GKU81240.1 hypothetical protein NCCP28_06360 [Niallia sp. NCCP-28]
MDFQEKISDEKRVENIKHQTMISHLGVHPSAQLSKSDFDFLIKQAEKLEWIKKAIQVCNEEKLSPQELAIVLSK